MPDINLEETIKKVVPVLEEKGIDYLIEEEAALYLQNVDLNVNKLDVTVQWDRFHELANLFNDYDYEIEDDQPLYWSFKIIDLQLPVVIKAFPNEVIQSDSYRVENNYAELELWVKHYDFYYFKKEEPYKLEIQRMLMKLQQSHLYVNDVAWNQEAYDAWVNRFGTPEEAAKKIKENPYLKLPKILPHLGQLQGKKVLHLMGSHATKAIAMGMLGADTTVLDLSQENARYAQEVADKAEVNLTYIVSDVLEAPRYLSGKTFDLLLMELGVMHYFVDLFVLAKTIYDLLEDGGEFLLHEFHPISTKLIRSSGKKHKADGNYFDRSIHHKKVAFSKHLKTSSAEQSVIQRYWTMGEIITVFAQAGLVLKQFEEYPNMKKADSGLPKTFLLVFQK